MSAGTGGHSPTAEIDSGFEFEFVPGGVDPKDLIIGANVRLDAKLEQDADLLASIRSRGVRTAINAYRNADGKLVVLRGQRRTLAAVLAGRAKVPVMLEPEPSETDRVVDQVGENDHRAGLDPGEHVAAYEQLAAVGLSADQIAAMMSVKPEKVRAGLAVAGSDKARTMMAQLPKADLFHAQAFAEFADDPATLSQLEATVRRGYGWDHALQSARDRRQRENDRQAAEDALAATGVKVLRGTERISTYGPSDKTRRLDTIRAKPGSTAKMTRAKHASCKGHAGYIDLEYSGPAGTYTPTTVFVCLNPSKYGHELFDSATATGRTRLEDMDPDEAAQQRAKNRLTAANNAAMRSARAVRIRKLAELAGRAKMPAGAGRFLATAFTVDNAILRFSVERSWRCAHEVLGVENPPQYGVSEKLPELAAVLSDARCQVLTLVMVLAAYEDNIGADSWRLADAARARYLTFLSGSCGHELSPVEEMAAGLREVCNVDDLDSAEVASQ